MNLDRKQKSRALLVCLIIFISIQLIEFWKEASEDFDNSTLLFQRKILKGPARPPRQIREVIPGWLI